MLIAKTSLVFALLVVDMTGCASSEAEQQVRTDALVKSVTIPVQGMSCDACAARIKKNLAGIDGVLGAQVSFDDKRAVVQYDATKLEPKRLDATIRDLGFTVGTPVEATP